MPYIKISDPNIIDLAAWHQVINVVNQHSDALNSITTNFAINSGTTTNYNAENYAKVFDIGSQQILYGRVKATASNDNSNYTWYGEVVFSGQGTSIPVFGDTPVITATAQSSATSNANDDVICTIYKPTRTGFWWKIQKAQAATVGIPHSTATPPITGTVYINWIAIGPKG